MSLQQESDRLRRGTRVSRSVETYDVSILEVGEGVRAELREEPSSNLLYTWSEIPMLEGTMAKTKFILEILRDLDETLALYELRISCVDAFCGTMSCPKATELVTRDFLVGREEAYLSRTSIKGARALLEILKTNTLRVFCCRVRGDS